MIAAERIIYNGAPTFHIERPASMYIPGYFVHRPLWADVEFLVYKVWRRFYVSIWFYFAPTIILILNYTIPLFSSSEEKE